MSKIGRVAPFLIPAGPGVTYATWDPANKSANITLSNGNLTATDTTAGVCTGFSTLGKTTGKWYIEITVVSAVNALAVGIANASQLTSQYPGGNTNSIGYGQGGSVFYNASVLTTYASYTNGDVIGIAYDAAAGTVTFYKNGVSQGTPAASLTGTIYAVIGSTGGANFSATANFGASAFAYSVPSGYNAGLY